MNPFIQVIVVLFVILCFAGIGYALIYNFMASKNNEGLVSELNKQHKTDMNNIQKLANDVNTNDKLLADNYDTLRARIDANQIELLQFIDLKQDALLQSMNMDLVVQRLDQASADMLVQLVQREVAILKVIVQTQSTLLSKIQEVNNVTLDFVDSKFKETAASVKKNYEELTTFMSAYITKNDININNITNAISQLNVVHHALEQQQMDLQNNMNSTNMNFSLLQADLQAKYTYLLDMIISDENSSETKLALLLTQTIWVDTATNFVGIGTKNPKDFLEIKQTGDTRFRVSGGTAGVNLCVATDKLTGASSNCSSVSSDNTGNIAISSYDNNGNMYLQGADINQGGNGGNVLIGTRAIPKNISTPLPGSGINVKPMLYVNGPIVSASGIELGATNQKNSAANAGLISYPGNSLDISGGGSNIDNRTLNFWADGGSYFKSKTGSGAKVTMGDLVATTGTFNGQVKVTGNVSTVGDISSTGNVSARDMSISTIAASSSVSTPSLVGSQSLSTPQINLTAGNSTCTLTNNNGTMTSSCPMFAPLFPIPIGGIIFWSGTVNTVPSGWALCEGGTFDRSDGKGKIVAPDLRGRFIKGQNGGDVSLTNWKVNDTGGSETQTLTTNNLPAHSHSGTTSTNGNHSHAASGTDSGWCANGGVYFYMTDRTGRTAYTQGSGDHNHSFTTDNGPGKGTAFWTLPPFYVLAYIMKI